MPSSKPEIAELSAEINGGALSAEGLKFDMAVNSFPVVKGTIARTDGDISVLAPVSEDVISAIGTLQTRRLEGRTDPDLNVAAQDGLGGSVEYRGFISAPVLELTRVSTTNSISSVGQAALLDALDLSIYKASSRPDRREVDTGLKPLPEAKDGDVPGTIAAVTDVLVENYELSLRQEKGGPVMKELLRLQHAINNNGPLEIWKEILDASEVKYESWEEAFKKAPIIAKNLGENIKRMLLAGTPGFWNRARSLMADFQMFYVPAFDGVGRFERADKKVGEPEGDLELSVSGFSAADGSPRILQPGGVVMYGRARDTDRMETSQNPNIPRAGAFAPNPLLQGFIQKEMVPLWLTRRNGSPVLGTEVDKGSGSGDKVDLSLEERKKRQEQGLEYNEEVQLLSDGIMTELCEVMFKEIQLTHSTASATVPLDFTLNDKIGKRWNVKIKSKDGAGAKFEAFVSAISHSVDLRQGKELNSFSRISFTHAKYA